jgi:hypothetical protein
LDLRRTECHKSLAKSTFLSGATTIRTPLHKPIYLRASTFRVSIYSSKHFGAQKGEIRANKICFQSCYTVSFAPKCLNLAIGSLSSRQKW